MIIKVPNLLIFAGKHYTMNQRYAPLSLLFRVSKQSLLIAGLILTVGSLLFVLLFAGLSWQGLGGELFDIVFTTALFAFPLGAIFIIVALTAAYKKYKLLKYGRFKKGYIHLMLPASDMGGEGNRVTIHYYYTGASGRKLYGEDTTPDLAILTYGKKDDEVKIAVSEEDETKSCLVLPEDMRRYGWTM